MIKRTLAFVVCLVMMLSLMPLGAMASELEPLFLPCIICGSTPCVCDTVEAYEADEPGEAGENTVAPYLTITANGSVEKGQGLLFKIKGDGYVSVVALHRGESGIGSLCIEGLTLGSTYTIEPLGKWAWRYSITPATATVTIQADSSQNVINFNVSQTNYNWLSSESYKVF